MEIEATKTFKMSKECMSNEGELIGLCEGAVTKKMVEVKEVSLHLPYRTASRSVPQGSPRPRIGNWLAEAKAQPSAPRECFIGNGDSRIEQYETPNSS